MALFLSTIFYNLMIGLKMMYNMKKNRTYDQVVVFYKEVIIDTTLYNINFKKISSKGEFTG